MKTFLAVTSIVVGILLVLFIIWLIIGDIAFHKFLSHKSMDKMQQGHLNDKDNPYDKLVDWPFVNQAPHKEISITSNDKTKLVGYCYDFLENAHRYIIAFHGWGSIHVEQTKFLHHLQNAFHVSLLLVSQRGHEKSGGRFLTMSEKEQQDAYAWVQYIKGIDKDAEILLYGSSFGAATILRGASIMNDEIKGVIEDSSFQSAYKQFSDSTKIILKQFYWFILWPLYLSGILFHNINLKKADVVGIIKDIKVPVCLMHAGEDKMINPNTMDVLFDALSSDIHKEKHLFPKGDHCLECLYDEQGYYQVADTFIENYLNW